MSALSTSHAEMLAILKVTEGNIRSLGPAGALAHVYSSYEVWLAGVQAAIAKADAALLEEEAACR